MRPETHKYSATLDLARFLICLLVVVAHAAPVALIGETASIALNSGIFSTHFFALSGFIICSTSGYWRDSLSDYAVRRIGRLLPVHWVGFALTVPWLFLGVETAPVRDVARATFWWAIGMQGFLWSSHSDLYSSLNLPAWSVTPLLFGTLALPVLKVLRVHEWSVRRLAAAMASTWILRLAYTVFFHAPDSLGGTGAAHVRPEGHILEILLGGMAAMLFAHPAVQQRFRWLASGRSLATIAVVTIASLVIATASGGREGAYYVVHGPIFPLALLLVVSAHANNGAVERFCARPWVKTAGELSILVFLLHMPFIYLSSRVLARLHMSESIWAGAISTLTVAAAVTALSYAMLPWFNRVQNALKRPRTTPVAVPAPITAPPHPGVQEPADLLALTTAVNAFRSSPDSVSKSAAAAKGQ